jgi:hypothetical protein
MIRDPDVGSDAASVRSTARKDGDHYVINGTKRFITNAPRAHSRGGNKFLGINGFVSQFLCIHRHAER